MAGHRKRKKMEALMRLSHVSSRLTFSETGKHFLQFPANDRRIIRIINWLGNVV
jgi:hypothetical protein